MSEILGYYDQQAKSRLSDISWVAQLQSKALSSLHKKGFPTRHHEDWKYTQVESILSQSFVTAQSKVTSSYPNKEFQVPVANQVTIHNAEISLGDWTHSLPKGVLILPLMQALTTHPDLVKPFLGHVLKQEHGFHYLNTAMLHTGVFIYVPEDVCIKEPVALTHYQDQDNQAVYLRHLIIMEKGSQLSVIEDYSGVENTNYFTNTVSEIKIGPNAKVEHFKIQRESKAAFHMGHVVVNQSEHSEFSSHSLSLGGKVVRSDVNIDLEEQHASCLMNGIYAPSAGQHVDHHTLVRHLVPNCGSEQDYKGILKGQSRAVFNGKVFVAKDAQHTNAHQQNKNLLLSANAEVDTKPQLEIFADDVVCSHGATVGQLDEEAIFYLETRGISRSEASHYLIQAFANGNLRMIPNDELADWMSNLLTQQLENANENR
ncbi:Fe-S cluster assembly protein SufD [Legionella waltersii]|uniref:ABC transporter permease n=1 Tax=Legionella waltersii TaxID=66969 RepID=A0A0W1ADE8_9GAMM|nr:Fe-S cluster assembly protein SufD [Legionella waltersii]KTD79361.1 ABC transporter permease [Legionella waltersii]SNU99850.1 ABC transporter permease [Legionella waltersii]